MSTSHISPALAVAIGLISFQVYAQAPGAPNPALPPAPPPMLAPASPGLAPTPVAQTPVAQGEVKRMLINPYGELDGLRLVDGTIIKFPPHMAEALSAAVKPGQSVRVLGLVEARGVVKADAIINLATSQTLIEQPPSLANGRPLPPHLRAQNLQPQSVEGRVDAVMTGPRGEANGVILSNGSIIRFPPESLRLSVQQGAPFAASGLGTRNTYGTSLEAISMGTSLSALQPLYDAVR
jgi:hypothetical protein